MKTPILAVFLMLGAAAWADGPPPLPGSYASAPQATAQPQPNARPTAQAYPQAAAPPAGGPARYAAAPLTRTAYPSRGGVRPAARPTPAPQTGPILHVGNFSPFWSAALRLGAGLPLGDMAKFNGVGAGGQADVFYQAAPATALDVFAGYTGMPATALPAHTSAVFYTGAPQPITVLDLGLKGLWQFYDVDAARFFVDGGVGYVSLNRTKETAAIGVPGPGETTWTEGSGPSISGLLLTAGLGITYELIPSLKLLGEVDFNAVDLSGGTGDMPQYAQPSVGLQYDFK
jgi:hypothetical protein